MSLVCDQCRQEISDEPHRCLSILMSILQEIDKQQKFYNDRLMRIEDSVADLNNLVTLPSSISLFDEIEHDMYGCSECKCIPIKGIRFKCKQCLEFDLCANCRENTSHLHSDFFIIPKTGVHEGVGCDGCGEAPIKSVRYSCRECGNFDYCHRCYLNNVHAHTSFEVILPLVISIEIYPNRPDMIFRPDEEFILYIVITNKSLQPVRQLSLRKIQGSLPFSFDEESFDLYTHVGEKKTLVLRRIITGDSGSYAASFQLFSEYEREIVGEPIRLNFTVCGNISLSNLDRSSVFNF